MKNLTRVCCGIAGCLVLLASSLRADEPADLAAPMPVEADPPCQDPAVGDPSEPSASSLTWYPPGMFGDLLVVEPMRRLSGNAIESALPAAFLSSFKISENESPRPLDRIFLTGNFYSGVDRSFLSGGGAEVFREMIGFEKTFLEGDASVGVRLPYFQLTGASDLSETRLGDLSVILKYAFINNRATGTLVSGGVVLTAPTGPGLPLPGQSTVNPMYVQPWLGGVWNWKGWFVQNFTALAVPADARDATLFFKSVAAGYWLYRSDDASRLVRAVVPDAELHLNTPLNHRGLDSLPIGVPDMLDFTSGCYFFLRRAVLGVAVGTPLAGPKPYEYQVLTNLNFRF